MNESVTLARQPAKLFGAHFSVKKSDIENKGLDNLSETRPDRLCFAGHGSQECVRHVTHEDGGTVKTVGFDPAMEAK
jgi:hypothetical protein